MTSMLHSRSPSRNQVPGSVPRASRNGWSVISRPHPPPFGWFMTFVQMQTFVAMATAQLAAWNRLQELKAIPFTNYVALSLPLAASQGCGQAALSFVNFPTKVIFKSAKLIPTMMMGMVLIRRRWVPPMSADAACSRVECCRQMVIQPYTRCFQSLPRGFMRPNTNARAHAHTHTHTRIGALQFRGA